MKTARSAARTTALAAALALALFAPATAFAADPTSDAPAEASGTPAEATASTGATSTITGTIHATTLSAKVPTVVPFNIDPGATQWAGTASGQKRGQFTSPSNYVITNYSAVDVYGYVSNVTVEKATLVNKTTDLAKTGGDTTPANVKVMVGLGDIDSEMTLADQNDWLKSGTQTYYAFNKTTKGKLVASTNAPSTAGGTVTMHIYGAVKNGGWAEGDNFVVKPVFKIVAAEPA